MVHICKVFFTDLAISLVVSCCSFIVIYLLITYIISVTILMYCYKKIIIILSSIERLVYFQTLSGDGSMCTEMAALSAMPHLCHSY